MLLAFASQTRLTHQRNLRVKPVVSAGSTAPGGPSRSPRFSRYNDIYGGFEYPSFVVSGNAGNFSGLAGSVRGGTRASQTDFSIRRPSIGRRFNWNGLLLCLPARLAKWPGLQRSKGHFNEFSEFVQLPTADGGAFPSQFSWLRTYYNAAVRELCVVSTADAPVGMGGSIRVQKGGVSYAVYLVETTDPNATPVRVATSAGTKAIRAKT